MAANNGEKFWDTKTVLLIGTIIASSVASIATTRVQVEALHDEMTTMAKRVTELERNGSFNFQSYAQLSSERHEILKTRVTLNETWIGTLRDNLAKNEIDHTKILSELERIRLLVQAKP